MTGDTRRLQLLPLLGVCFAPVTPSWRSADRKRRWNLQAKSAHRTYSLTDWRKLLPTQSPVKLVLAVLVLLSAHLPMASSESYYYDEPGNHPLPRFLPTPSNYTYTVGQMAVMECAVENLGAKRVVWRKASDPNPLTVGSSAFVEDSRFMVEHPPLKPYWNLIIRDVQMQDAGVYECQVSSKVRHLRHHVLLMVKEPKPTTPVEDSGSFDRFYNPPHQPNADIRIDGEAYVDKGDRVLLTCNATGSEYPPDDIDWFLDGDKLTTDVVRKIYIKKFVSLTSRTIVSILEIKDAKLSDSGVYVCRTSNLQVTDKRVNVLNAGTNNQSKRAGTERKASRDQVTFTSLGSAASRSRMSPGVALLSLLLLVWTRVAPS